MVTLSDSSRPILRVEVLGGKIPYSIEMADNSPFLFAGLWEAGHSKEATFFHAIHK
jgi:putative SOS response-associated peptidase YedK